MSKLRATSVLAAFFGLTVPLMPIQAVLVRVSDTAARRFPHWYHRQVCKILGVRLNIEGEIAREAAVLLVANHTSWLDIPVLSAVAPVSFVAKKEVGTWPFVSSLARLQRTVFVDRTRRQATGEAASEISERLSSGDTIVLFAEGTSSDGNRVLPFKTSLFGAVFAGSDAAKAEAGPAAVVQTAAIVYTHLHGVPLGRADRPRVGWYGDMEMQSHAWEVLQSGPLNVTVKIGRPVPLSEFENRKELAMRSEREVRRSLHSILRDRESLEPVEPGDEARKLGRPVRAGQSEKFT